MTRLSMSNIQVTQSSDRDWSSLLGLLLLTGLTGLSAFAMVVDISALRETFQPNLSIPDHHQGLARK